MPPPIEESLVVRALAGAAVAAIITAAARKTRTLSESGQWAAFFVGIAAAAAGWVWAGTLIAFFVTSSVLTHWRKAEKMRRTEGTLPRPGDRNATQVLANGGVFALLALGSVVLKNERLAYGALGALATAAADTWSTEIGTLFGDRPRLITTWKPVDTGMSGGVTGSGFAAGIAGAFFVAMVGAFAMPDDRAQFATAAFVGGFGGCLADSFIGATLQSRRFCDRCHEWSERRVHPCGYRTRHARGLYWMSNDAVNFCATFAGGVIAVAVGRLLGR